MLWMVAAGLITLVGSTCISLALAARSPMGSWPPMGNGDVTGRVAILPQVSSPWVRIYIANLKSASLAFLGGLFSGGLVALGHAACLGTQLGRDVAATAAATRELGGAGVGRVLAGGLLPHGLVEIPTFLLVWALSARRGIALLVAIRRKRLCEWSAALRGDLRLLVPVAIPLLLLSAVLEDRGNPFFVDRYLLGTGRHPEIGQERRIGPPFVFSEAKLSRGGDLIAAIDTNRSRVLLLDPRSGVVRALPPMPERTYLLGAPSWSPTGRQVVVVRYRGQTEGGALLILDAQTGQLRVIRNQPRGECVRASWSPRGDVVACVLVRRDPRQEKPATTNIWLAELKADRWRPATTFPATATIPRASGLDWSADGQTLAFVVRQPGGKTKMQGGSSSDCYWLCLADVDSSRLRKVAPLLYPGPLAWSPDGTRIALVEPTPEARAPSKEGHLSLAASVSLVDVRTGERGADLARVWADSDPSWSPDGRYLLYLRLGTCIEAGPIPE